VSFVHIVTFKWNDGVSGEPVAAALRELIPGLQGVQSYRCGTDLGLAPGSHDFGVVGVFDSRDHFVAYRDHPEHQRILKELVVPNLADKTTVQLED
jgi:heme-degrading monooxygenase HmoA